MAVFHSVFGAKVRISEDSGEPQPVCFEGWFSAPLGVGHRPPGLKLANSRVGEALVAEG